MSRNRPWNVASMSATCSGRCSSTLAPKEKWVPLALEQDGLQVGRPGGAGGRPRAARPPSARRGCWPSGASRNTCQRARPPATGRARPRPGSDRSSVLLPTVQLQLDVRAADESAASGRTRARDVVATHHRADLRRRRTPGSVAWPRRGARSRNRARRSPPRSADGEHPAARLGAELDGPDLAEQVAREPVLRFDAEAERPIAAPGAKVLVEDRAASTRAWTRPCGGRRCARPPRGRLDVTTRHGWPSRGGVVRPLIGLRPCAFASTSFVSSSPQMAPSARRRPQQQEVGLAARAAALVEGAEAGAALGHHVQPEPGAVRLAVLVPVGELVLAHALDRLREAAGHRRGERGDEPVDRRRRAGRGRPAALQQSPSPASRVVARLHLAVDDAGPCRRSSGR